MLAACYDCYDWFEQFIAPLKTWDEFCKWKTTPEGTKTLDLAKVIAKKGSDARPDFTQCAVETVAAVRQRVGMQYVVMNKTELKASSGLNYLPKRLQVGPKVVVTHASGVKEKLWVFEDPQWGGRRKLLVEDYCGEGMRGTLMAKENDVWDVKSQQVLAHFAKERAGASRARKALETRRVPISAP